MSPPARALLALACACAALLRSTSAHRPSLPYMTPPTPLPPPTTFPPPPPPPQIYCNSTEIGDPYVEASAEPVTVKITHVFNQNLPVHVFLVQVEDLCSKLSAGVYGVRYEMKRQTVEACGGVPLRVHSVSRAVYSPVVLECGMDTPCGPVAVAVDQFCRLVPITPV